jgi:uncharacterized membrane protein
MRLFRRTHFAAFLVVVGIYIAVRLWGLTSSCLWFDEIFSVHAAEHDWNSLWSFVALDLIHPPLFYALLKIWILIGGESLMWLRLFPLLVAIAAIYPFIKFCIELNVPLWSRILALFLLAVNGSLIKYSQEVRMYSLLMCLSLFSMWLFARYFEKGKGLIALAVINVLLVWTHYFGWFVVASELIAIIVFQRIKWRATAGMFAATVVSFVPWIVAVAMASSAGSGLSQNIGWMSRPGFAAIVQLKLALIEPFYYQASSVDPISIYKVSVPLLLITGVSLVLYLLRWRKQPSDERRGFELAALFTACPLVAAFLLSWLTPYSIWGNRHLIVIFAPVAILLALALTKIDISTLRIAVMSLIFLFTGYAFLLRAQQPTPQYIWCAWEQLAQKINTNSETHIYAVEDAIAYHLWFATRQKPNIHVFKLEAGVPEDKAYFLPRGFADVSRKQTSEIDDLAPWLAYRDVEVGRGLSIRLSEKGFEQSAGNSVDVNGTKAFLIELRKH